MATISLNIPDLSLSRVVDALCARGHWSADLGIAKGPYAKSELARWLREETHAYEVRVAAAAAAAAVVDPDVVAIS